MTMTRGLSVFVVTIATTLVLSCKPYPGQDPDEYYGEYIRAFVSGLDNVHEVRHYTPGRK